jgi:hypothetical protein
LDSSAGPSPSKQARCLAGFRYLLWKKLSILEYPSTILSPAESAEYTGNPVISLILVELACGNVLASSSGEAARLGEALCRAFLLKRPDKDRKLQALEYALQ